MKRIDMSRLCGMLALGVLAAWAGAGCTREDRDSAPPGSQPTPSNPALAPPVPYPAPAPGSLPGPPPLTPVGLTAGAPLSGEVGGLTGGLPIPPPVFPGGPVLKPGLVPVRPLNALRVETFRVNLDPLPHFMGRLVNPTRREVWAQVSVPLFDIGQRPVGAAQTLHRLRVPARGQETFAVVPVRPFVYFGEPVAQTAPPDKE